MKAVIMCAGKGVRMRPITEKHVKPMIPINGKPFLRYLLENLQEAGFDEFCFVVHYKKEQIIDYIKKLGINAVFADQPEQKGTADAARYAKDFVGKDNFLLVSGDNLYSARDFKDCWRKDNLNYIKGLEVDNPSRYGVLIENNGFLEEIKEKPKKFVGNLINTGLMKLTSEIFDAIEKIKISPRGELELTDALTLLAKDKKVRVLEIKDYWKDLGKPEDIPEMEEFLNAGGRI